MLDFGDVIPGVDCHGERPGRANACQIRLVLGSGLDSGCKNASRYCTRDIIVVVAACLIYFIICFVRNGACVVHAIVANALSPAVGSEGVA
ncbi:MAG: hypothetical protein HUJ83_11155 [Veillonella sp.]|nr:hypothetical protein [Veillonella sp.]